ncbi:hypothetical protein F5X68DRAFT_236491 [Plectosphaerella plurivora]|uniref:Uncharacterized protein n=1 Tax=Plectosphaerella plurivora TaxID=936078 RepID=A0A9P8V3V7_9PEZI|nr:hypothetical protein F5X68DRAFT_236491 [Plectosphaerella plurivora]
MPCIRGVEVFLIQGIDPGQPRDPLNPNDNDRRFPEFPHPDSSSIRLSPRPDASQNSDTLADGHHIPKTNSRVSAYVPSEQGLRFAFEWHVKRPEEHPYFIYFVVLFNGRRMVSWGADPSKVDRGITEYALYEQGNKKGCSVLTAATDKHGMEKRYFYFFSEDDAQPASDGGLIEVQAFRAKGRRLRAAAPPEYRGQENYGIMCPSGGMVESAQDLSYYDWHLHDRIDDPFITFRFYYRSLANLKYLSIVPQSYRMPEVSTTSSLYFEDAAYHAGEARDPGPVEYPDIITPSKAISRAPCGNSATSAAQQVCKGYFQRRRPGAPPTYATRKLLAKLLDKFSRTCTVC